MGGLSSNLQRAKAAVSYVRRKLPRGAGNRSDGSSDARACVVWVRENMVSAEDFVPHLAVRAEADGLRQLRRAGRGRLHVSEEARRAAARLHASQRSVWPGGAFPCGDRLRAGARHLGSARRDLRSLGRRTILCGLEDRHEDDVVGIRIDGGIAVPVRRGLVLVGRERAWRARREAAGQLRKARQIEITSLACFASDTTKMYHLQARRRPSKFDNSTFTAPLARPNGSERGGHVR